MVRKLRGAQTKRPENAGASRGALDRDGQLQAAAAHYNAGRLDAAADVYAALCLRDSRDATAWYLRGLVDYQRNKNADAALHLRRGLEVCHEPALRVELQRWLGRVLCALEQRVEARVHLHAAAKGVWDDADKLYELTLLLVAANDFDNCEPLYARIVELAPRHVEANAELSLFDFRRKDYEAAWRHASTALEQDPEVPAALRVLGHVHHEIGEGKRGAELYRAAAERFIAGRGTTNILAVYESMLGALVYADVTDDELRVAHEQWHKLVKATPRPRKPVLPRGERPLRVGYVSPDFCHHAVAFFFEPLLHNHDPAVVTPVLYSNTTTLDEVSARMRSVAEWRDITGLSDVQAADLIERDGIDILVDLAGFTTGNRMGVFLQRPAPLQVNYLGYPCTTGLAEMDYRFTDEDCDPLGETDANYTEQLVRLPGGFYAWRQPDAFPPAGPPPSQKNGYITFGSLNTLAKLTDDVIALWSRVMNDVPRSRLILQAAPLTNAWARSKILAKFAAHGVDASRIDLHGRMPMREHLDLYNQIDIALDPFPWAGHTTTCLALFMSVPVVTLRGRRVASRMSASVLRRMGFDAWIAETPEQYLSIVKSLASDVDRLAALRLAQRMVFTSSDLMDGNRLARVVEAAFQAIWDHHAPPSSS